MANLAERKRLRELRARPWLLNSALLKLEKHTCRSARLDTPKGVVVEQTVPTPPCPDSGLFEESLVTALDRLSLSASKQHRRGPEVARDSDDEDSETSHGGVSAELPVGGKQVTTSRIPGPRKLGDRVRSRFVAGRKLLSLGERCRGIFPACSGVKSRETKAEGLKPQSPSLKSCLKSAPGARIPGSSPSTRKVRFAEFKRVVLIPGHLKTREFAPQCTRHSRCREMENAFTCFEKRDEEDERFLRDNPSAWSKEDTDRMGCVIWPLRREWFDDQERKGHDYFAEYGDMLRGWYCFDDDGQLTADPVIGSVMKRDQVIYTLETF